MLRRRAAAGEGSLKIAYRLLGIGTVAALALVGWEAQRDRDRRFAEAEEAVLAIATVISEHVDRSIQSADLAVVATIEAMDTYDGRQRSPADLKQVVQRIGNAVPQVRLLLVIDADGTLIADNLADTALLRFADRAYFQFHRDHPSADPYLSEPTTGRRTGQVAFNWSRRFDRADGSFGGVVVAVIEPAYFREFYARLLHRPEESASIFRRDGQLLARLAATPAEIDASQTRVFPQLPQPGSRAAVVGERNLRAYQVSRQFPVVVTAARSLASIERDWQGRAAFFAAIVLVASALVALLLRSVDKRRRRWGESRFGAVAEASPTALLMARTDGRIEFANAQAARLLGYPAGQLTGMQIESLLPERFRADHPAHRAEYQRYPQVRPMGNGRDLFARHRDGHEIPVEIGLNPIATDGVTMVLASIVDLSERKQAELRLRQSQRMEAIGQLTGGVAHDFNNLLAVVQGNLELLDEQVEDETQRELIDESRRSVARGASLTQRLLAYARQQTLAPAIVDLRVDIGRMSELLRRTLRETIEFRTFFAADLWPVRIDRHQLDDALLNLAVNAAFAMPQGGALVIEAHNTELDEDYCESNDEVTPGRYVLLAVSDTGTGMTAEVLQRAFEPFFTTKGSEGGSGLGLSMVFGFVKQSGGHIKIYSEPGIGTTVRLYLPAALADAGVLTAEFEGPIPRARDGEVILVVEDDADVRKVTVRTLESLGYRTVQAKDSSSALELFSATPRIDLVLSDVVLPRGVDGPTLVAGLRGLRPDLRVIFISGYTANLIEQSGFVDASIPVLSKPVLRKELARVIRAVLDGGVG